MATTVLITPEPRHEAFCLPRDGMVEPRLEYYSHLSDDPDTGRSRPTHDVHRCLECGSATYTPRI